MFRNLELALRMSKLGYYSDGRSVIATQSIKNSQHQEDLALVNESLTSFLHEKGSNLLLSRDIKKLLSLDLISNYKNVAFDSIKSDIRFAIDASINNVADEEALICILRLLFVSPFQLDLQCLAYSLIVKNDKLELLKNLSENHRSFAFLIRSFNEKSFLNLNYGKLDGLYSEIFETKEAYDFIQKSNNLHDRDNIYNFSNQPQNFSKISLEPLKGFSSLSIGTIFLNEQKYLGLNLLQHYNYCDEWIFVEGACLGYPPRKVSAEGRSLDNSETILRIFPDRYRKIRYIKHGWTISAGEDAKSELRNEYMKRCKSSILLVLDADEFYHPEVIAKTMEKFDDSTVYSITLPQVHFWKDLDQFITGEYYDISHTRFFRFIPGSRYIRNHNFPEVNNNFLHQIKNLKVNRRIIESLGGDRGFSYADDCCFHMGFAKDFDDMRDKSDYYVNRGEDKTRKSTTASRAAWFDDNLPDKCRIRKWGGSIPFALKVGDR